MSYTWCCIVILLNFCDKRNLTYCTSAYVFCSGRYCHFCWWSPYTLVTVSVFRSRHLVDRRAETDLYCQLPADVHSCHNWSTSAQSLCSHRPNAGTTIHICNPVRDRNLQNSQGMSLHLLPRKLRRSRAKQNSWSLPLYYIVFSLTDCILLVYFCEEFVTQVQSLCVLNLLDVSSKFSSVLCLYLLAYRQFFYVYCLQTREKLAFNVSAKWKTLCLMLLTREHCSWFLNEM